MHLLTSGAALSLAVIMATTAPSVFAAPMPDLITSVTTEPTSHNVLFSREDALVTGIASRRERGINKRVGSTSEAELGAASGVGTTPASGSSSPPTVLNSPMANEPAPGDGRRTDGTRVARLRSKHTVPNSGTGRGPNDSTFIGILPALPKNGVKVVKLVSPEQVEAPFNGMHPSFKSTGKHTATEVEDARAGTEGSAPLSST